MSKLFKDSKVFLQLASEQIKKDINFSQSISALTFFALGIERVLKGILWDLNPLYILVDQDFNNSLPVLYEEKIILDESKRSKLRKDPNAGVITFRKSLEKACFCSPTSNLNKGKLYTLSYYRDIVAHNDLDLIDKQKVNELLTRDYFPIISSFSEELSIN